MREIVRGKGHVAALGGLALAVMILMGAKGPPPTIDQIPGDYSVIRSSTEVNLDNGNLYTWKSPAVWTITQLDDMTVNIHMEDLDNPAEAEDVPAVYVSGVLMIAQADNETLADNARMAYIAVSGRPGKLKLSCEFLRWADESEGACMEAGKCSGKQMIPR